MEEVWLPVVGYEGRYEVSNIGRVKSILFGKERLLKPRNDNRGGYPYVNLWLNKSESKKVHRLLAIAFIPNPENKPHVLHNDNNPKNCILKNLRWGTHKENMIQMTNDGHNRNKGRLRSNHYCSRKITQFSLNMEFIKEWDCILDITDSLGFDNSAISKCCRGKYKTVGGFIWRYK